MSECVCTYIVYLYVAGGNVYYGAGSQFNSELLDYYEIKVNVANTELLGLSSSLGVIITPTNDVPMLDDLPLLSIEELVEVGTELYQVRP